MKNNFKILLLIASVNFMNHATAFAQNPESNTSELTGTAWRMAQNVINNASTTERVIIFRKDNTFETQNADGSTFNGGKYYVTDPNTFVTIHHGSAAANLYHFEITNDTLHFGGFYIDSNFSAADQRVKFYPIDEIWVKIKDWKENAYGIQFSEEKNLDAVLEKSQKEGKMIFMDCYTHWCGPCKYLSANIFTLKSVGDYFNEHFVNVKFDMESVEGKKIATKYGVRAYPTLLFLNSKGEVEHTSIGCGGEQHLLMLGKTALDPTKNLKAMKNKLNAGDRSAETILNYLSANNYATDKDKLLKEYFKNKTKADRLTEDSWRLYNFYDNSTNSDQFKFFIKNRSEYSKKFGEKEVKNKFKGLLYANMRDSVKYHSLQKIDPKLFAEHKAGMEFQKATYTFNSDKKKITSWLKMLETAHNYFKLEGADAMEINDLCWKIYENYKTFDDIKALQLAKEWSYKSLQQKPDDIQIMDTYAHILFDLGQVDEAIRYEEAALKKAVEAKNPSAKFFTDELERFKAVKK